MCTSSFKRPGRSEDQHPVGEEDRLVDLVRDEDRGLSRRVADPHEFGLHDLARLRVERGERLVEQEHLGLERERAGEIDALPHAAGELVRIVPIEAAQPDQLE